MATLAERRKAALRNCKLEDQNPKKMPEVVEDAPAPPIVAAVPRKTSFQLPDEKQGNGPNIVDPPKLTQKERAERLHTMSSDLRRSSVVESPSNIQPKRPRESLRPGGMRALRPGEIQGPGIALSQIPDKPGAVVMVCTLTIPPFPTGLA